MKSLEAIQCTGAFIHPLKDTLADIDYQVLAGTPERIYFTARLNRVKIGQYYGVNVEVFGEIVDGQFQKSTFECGSGFYIGTKASIEKQALREILQDIAPIIVPEILQYKLCPNHKASAIGMALVQVEDSISLYKAQLKQVMSALVNADKQRRSLRQLQRQPLNLTQTSI